MLYIYQYTSYVHIKTKLSIVSTTIVGILWQGGQVAQVEPTIPSFKEKPHNIKPQQRLLIFIEACTEL